MSSQAASISAWWAVFDWLSIVAAFNVERHGPESSSDARRKTAARSCQGVRDHSACAARAASTPAARARAALGDVREDVALAVGHDGLEGLVRLDVLPADDERDLEALALHLAEPVLQLLALGRAGRVGLDRLVDGRRWREDARGAHGAILERVGWVAARGASEAPEARVGRGAGEVDAVLGARLGRGGAVDRRRPRCSRTSSGSRPMRERA